MQIFPKQGVKIKHIWNHHLYRIQFTSIYGTQLPPSSKWLLHRCAGLRRWQNKSFVETTWLDVLDNKRDVNDVVLHAQPENDVSKVPASKDRLIFVLPRKASWHTILQICPQESKQLDNNIRTTIGESQHSAKVTLACSTHYPEKLDIKTVIFICIVISVRMYICTYTQVHTVSIVERSLFQILLTSPKPHTLGPQNGRPNISENLKHQIGRSFWERTSVWQQCHHHLHHLLLLLQHLPLPVKMLKCLSCRSAACWNTALYQKNLVYQKPATPQALYYRNAFKQTPFKP